MPAVTPTPEKALFDLFCELFTADELLRFITHTYGKRLARELPGAGGKLSTVAFEAAGLLGRRGLVGSELFEALAIDAPNQRGTCQRF